MPSWSAPSKRWSQASNFAVPARLASVGMPVRGTGWASAGGPEQHPPSAACLSFHISLPQVRLDADTKISPELSLAFFTVR